MRQIITALVLFACFFPTYANGQKDTDAKRKARNHYVKYVNASQKIVGESDKHYQNTLKWLTKWRKSANNTYKKEIEIKIREFKKFPEKVSKLPAPLSEIKEIRSNDVKMLNCITDIYIEYQKQIKMAWEPMENSKIRTLMKKYEEHAQRYKALHKSFQKKYGKK
ncbi:hypothetical protein KKF34_00695 [Myxococcota bacterium]|nr:hypothetical protein [Myxococcota bacterium]MBU1382085.1 hypothetical protein [Myxococcota bacterium]MBU1495379.1 hypothetical protein [Myxococcota bacterium]